MKATLLDKSHDRTKFSCEEKSLTEYITKQVSQDIKKKLAACFVIVNNLNEVIGYYTLTSESLGRDTIPQAYQKRIPRNYSAPVILLGRLARDLSQKGTEVGEHLLLDALQRSFNISKESIGAMAVVVDPISQYAINFYAKYGFVLLPDSGKMFIPMKTIENLFK